MSYQVPAQFRSEFTGDIVLPQDGATYDAAISRWAVNAERKAAIIVYPKSVQDIALALKLIDLPLAIRGGGHSASGASSREDGLVIDLSRSFANVRVDVDAKVAYVGGGAIWKTVDEEAIKHGLATVGGTVNHTGVAGLTLGGGYGWLSGRYGLTIDNLLSATVVTASGDIVEASSSKNPDLFDGLRGGGSNFGVVSEFVLQLHPQRRTVFAGPLIFPRTPEILSQFKTLLREFWASAGEDDGAVAIVGSAPDSGLPIIALVAFHNGPAEAGVAKFKPFIDLGPVVNGTGEIPYEVLNSLQNHISGFGLNRYMKGAGVTLSKLLDDADPRLDQLAESQAGHGLLAVVLLELIPLKMIAAGDPERRFAFSAREASNVLVMLTWPTTAPAEVSASASGIAKALADITQDPSVLDYGNYEHEPTASRATQMFGASYPRLQTLKAKYDPNSRFDRWFPIVPAAL